MRASILVTFALVCCCVMGCEPEHFRAETRLLPDGSLERLVYQPFKYMPKSVRRSKVWEASRPAHKQTMNGPHQALRELIEPLSSGADYLYDDKKSPPPYWLANGKFMDVSAIPDHLLFEAPKGLPNGHLARKLQRREIGLVTEWIWEEILTDTVSLSDQRLARNELIETAIPIFIAACIDAWGPSYDLKKFEQWLRDDVADCFQELCDAHLQLALQKNKTEKEDDGFWDTCATILKRRGLDLFDLQPQLMKTPEQLQPPLNLFITTQVQKYVRNKHDQPLTNELVQDLLRTLELVPVATTDDAAPMPTETRLRKALNRAVLAKFGTQEKFEEQLNLLGIRIFGLYNWPLLHAQHLFDYRLEVPGIIVETNGTLTGERTLRWKFESAEAFPLGYAMRAKVAVLDAPALAKHFPRAKLDSREMIVEYLDIVGGDPELRTALNELSQKNDTTAWKAWQVAHPEAMRLYELLQPEKSDGR